MLAARVLKAKMLKVSCNGGASIVPISGSPVVCAPS
jgi:hypothetical protein